MSDPPLNYNYGNTHLVEFGPYSYTTSSDDTLGPVTNTHELNGSPISELVFESDLTSATTFDVTEYGGFVTGDMSGARTATQVNNIN